MREMVEKDKDYMNLVADIIDHKEFVKTQNFVHHLSNRYEHSLRVSYISYKITKALRLDYESVARGGLLHDFFFTEEKKNKKESISSLFMHSNYALINSRQHFELNEVEEKGIEQLLKMMCSLRQQIMLRRKLELTEQISKELIK